ncbi:hypothetical protein FG386_001651 [Cryptosporidium ryanae]|uniref:uncharacterized protein n=1 Tax=Cryptosporidium ryanae TaxID=515981 RepID=UPI003519D831|nr:hypothetical protein FG386_001651 [Cryptosporidium ryanae]
MAYVRIEFSGGLEVITGNKSCVDVDLSYLESNSLKSLISYIRDNIIQFRKDHFVETGTKIKPGIIVLVNNCDWEIVGGEDYVLNNSDVITFIMTLHGG